MNLLSNGNSIDLWQYYKSPTHGYSVTKDCYHNPFGTSNLADLIIADVGAYGGFHQNITVLPDTQYAFTFWAFVPESKYLQVSMNINQQSTFGLKHWSGSNDTIGLFDNAIYVTPNIGTQQDPTPWSQFVWVFTTPTNTDPNTESTVTVNVTGSDTTGSGQLAIWGINFESYVSGALPSYVESSLFVYDIDSTITAETFYGPSIDLLDISGNPITSPFDPLRYVVTDYNLIRNGLGCKFIQWEYTQSNLPTQPGYTVTQGQSINPYLTSNLCDRIVSDPLSYGGLSINIQIVPDTTYTFSFYTYALEGGSAFAMKLHNETLGTQWWGGPSSSTGFISYAVYDYVSVVSEVLPWERYQWTFTIPSNVPDPGMSDNAKITIYIAANSDLILYGAALVLGTHLYDFEEPYSFSYTLDTIPAGNIINIPEVINYPSIDLYDNNELITTPFDPDRFYVYSRLGKFAIPYGNTFDVIEDNEYLYYFDYNNGVRVLANQELAPIDEDNPLLSGYHADLLQPSADPARLSPSPGATIEWPMYTDLTEGTTYTISVWAKAKYFDESVYLKINPAGTWLSDLYDTTLPGDFLNSEWKTINGSISVVNSNITGVSTSGGYNIGDLGIPGIIPSNRRLTNKRADHIKANHTDGTGTCFVEVSSLSDPPVDIWGVNQTFSTDIQAIRDAVFVYREIPYNPDIKTISLSSWFRIASDYVYIDSTGTPQIGNNTTITGSVPYWGLKYQLEDGTEIIKIFKIYNSVMYDWRLFQEYMSVINSASQDLTKPIGIGFFFKGDIAVYDGTHVINSTDMQSGYIGIDTDSWTRISFTFIANSGMQNRLGYTFRPGTSTPLIFKENANVISIRATQPSQPMIGLSPDPAYLPWAPIWSALYLYGLQIDEGDTASVYSPDSPYVPTYMMNSIVSTEKTYYPLLDYPSGTIDLVLGDIRPSRDQPEHNVGINVTGNHYYSTARVFLNLMKLSNAGRYRQGIDYYGVWSDMPSIGWWLHRYYDNERGDSKFNVFDSRIILTNISFNTGDTIFTLPMTNSGSWWEFDSSVYDKTFLGTGVATNTKIVSKTVDQNSNLVTFVVDKAFTGNSVLTERYEIKREPIDHPDILNLDASGYPRYIPPGYSVACISYRYSAPWNYAAGMLNHPLMPSGRYVLKWEGSGTISMINDIDLLASSYPVTEISRSSNRIIYDIDCSGNTSEGEQVHIKYALGTDIPEPLWTHAQAGFLIVIKTTDPLNHIRNIVLCEEKYESLIDSGSIFYPEWLERMKDYKCIRHLDWCRGNTFQSFAYNESVRAYVTDVSYESIVPWEIIIEQCNLTKKDCWINLHPSAPDDYQLYIANLFAELLDPTLHLYIEFGNEQWNGGLGTGYWLDLYVQKYNIVGDDVNAPNPAWDAHLKAYAMLSQHVFGLWESVFSGDKGRLHPVNLWDTPKTQKKRLVRVLSTIAANPTVAKDVWNYALNYCKNIYGIPYDAVGSNGYFADMGSTYINTLETQALPGYYEWTMNEIIPLAWESLDSVKIAESNHYSYLQNEVSIELPDGVLGRDIDGDLFKPAFLLYEGGAGDPGPTPYMFKAIAQLLWNEDGELDTIYNLYKEQLEWWKTLIHDDINKDIIVYNIWETPNTWSVYDQWGIADKSYYPDHQYFLFPRIRAITESANLRSYFNYESFVFSETVYSSKPKILLNDEWIKMCNVRILTNTGWRHIPAKVFKYKSNNEWK